MGRPVEYGAEVASAAREVHEAAGGIGARRLHLFVGEMASRLAAFGELEMTAETEAHLRRASAATLERLLAASQVPVRRRSHSLTKPGTLLPHVNFFQPVRRLTGRSREGARVVRRHDGGTTPYQRMLQSGVLVGARRAVLEKLYLSLNPLWLSRQIDAETEKLLGLAWRQGDSLSWHPVGNRNFEVTPLAR